MIKRKVEIFSAGCAVCQDTTATVERLAGPSCELRVLDMNDLQVVKRARALGVRSGVSLALSTSSEV
ncbi:MAG: hypothetical protein ACREU2_02930 [Steroidobacteraceae bacterium]